MKKKLCVMFSGNYSTRNLRLFKVVGILLLSVSISTMQVFAENIDTETKNQTITNNIEETTSESNTENLSTQQNSLTGKVTSEENETLPGVAILVKGTSQGTTTDVNGEYTLRNIPSDAVLVFSFIGMKAQEIPYTGQSVLNVVLEEETIGLEEVVAIGYGTQKKKDITSAIAIISTEEMAKAPTANVANALQGLSPGIEVQNNQGRPGELATVRIRGTGSVNYTNPLYVVDGVPMDNAYVNPNDVESMQVLKDAASSAIYGSRGANGVIIITTKSGKSGAPKVSYSGYYGIEKAWKQLDLLTIEQWADLVYDSNMASENSGVPSLALDIRQNGYDGQVTDWQSELFQTGAIHENNVSVSGGTDNGNYFFSANEYQQEGIIVYTPFKRYSVRMNSNWNTNKFKFGESISYTYSKTRVEGSNGGRSVIEEMIKITPNIPVRNPDYQGGYSGYDGGLVEHDASNPIGSLDRNRNFNYNKRFIASAFGEYEIIDGLQLRSTLGIISTEFQNRNLTLETNMLPKPFTNTSLSESSRWTYNWTWENMLTYNKVFGDHDLTVMAAYTSEEMKWHSMGAQGITIQTETNDILDMLEGGEVISGDEEETSRISYLGRIMYNYLGKYMLTVNFRRDGSSKFGPNNKWGNFPSASVAWRISDESFMENVDAISNLKLRTSYGVVGNDAPVGPYSYLSGLTSGRDYVFNSVKFSGVSVTAFNNPTLTWETVKQFDVGLDLELYRGTVEATVDYFDKRTEDMLIRVALPSSSGTTSTINRNVGTILNRGFEFSATFRKNIGDLNMSITGNATLLHNEVLDLGGYKLPPSGAVEPGNATWTEVGHQIGAFYGWKALGVFPDQAAIDAYTFNGAKIQPDAKPGDIQWADLGGPDESGPDGVIDDNDQYFMGNPIPNLTYGLTANFDYKNFDLSLFFQGISGNDIFAELVTWTEGMQNNFNAGVAALDRWKKPGDITDVPRAVRNDPNGNILKVSDRYIKDGSYLRLKNVSLGYTLPKEVINEINISNVRIYVTGRNLLTFTKYPFYDPEIGSGAIGTGGTANTSRGIDNGYYPQARTMIMGIQVDF